MKTITKSCLEKEVRNNVRELARVYNALAVPNIPTIYSPPGRNDFDVITAKGVTIYVECKRLGKKLEPAQIAYKNELIKRNCIFICYDGANTEELEGLIKIHS